MAEIKNSIKISAPITPYDTDDTYGTHFDEYGIGGFRSVIDENARNEITDDRRKEGMIVYCINEQTIWQLVGGISNLNWKVFKPSSSINNLIFGVKEPYAPIAETIWLNPITSELKYRDPTNTNWVLLNDKIIVDGGEF